MTFVIGTVKTSGTKDTCVVCGASLASIGRLSTLEDMSTWLAPCRLGVLRPFNSALSSPQTPWLTGAWRAAREQEAQVVLTPRGKRPEEDLEQFVAGRLGVATLEFSREVS